MDVVRVLFTLVVKTAGFKVLEPENVLLGTAVTLISMARC